MAECWYCKKNKGKRYCPPLENILCPVCCAKNRLKNIDCPEDCGYLEGAAFHAVKEEEKTFNNLMNSVPHGQYDDIFQNEEIAFVAFELESFIREMYINGKIKMTDRMVFECYKNLYTILIENKTLEKDQLTGLMKELMELYNERISYWISFIGEETAGQLFIRLMRSVKQMSGGKMGEFGYLNYLKNNLMNTNLKGKFIVEDKFKRKSIRPIEGYSDT